MGTRSTIARQNEDGSFDSIYCHCDGYPEHNGNLLLNHYQDRANVNALMALGNLSSLGEKIGSQHNFDLPPRNECNAYGRDRHELDTGAQHFPDVGSFILMLSESWTEWLYIYKPNGKWYFTNNPSPTCFKLSGSGAQRATCELTTEAIQKLSEED
jgi:hypothetical protein